MTREGRLASFGWQCVQSGEPRRGLDALQEAVRLSGRGAPYLKALAVAQAKASLVFEVVGTLNELVKLTPTDVEAWCMLGEISLERGDYATAARALGLCMQLDSSKAHPAGLRARALIKRAEKWLKKRSGGAR